VRAIGSPAMRFGEDHLRMLRAVRFAAAFGFALDDETRAAIERMAHLVTAVSPERIAAELRAMVSRPGRRRALDLLAGTGLAREVLPELAAPAGSGIDPAAWEESARVVDAVDEPDLPLALAILAHDRPAAVIAAVADRLRLSNRERRTAAWLHATAAEFAPLDAAALDRRPWSRVQPRLADEAAPFLADMLRAGAACGRGTADAAAWVSAKLRLPRETLDPPPLVSGHDLLAAGIPAGRGLGRALGLVRDWQLDGVVASPAEAIERLRREPPS